MKRIQLISGPRNISTAIMYAFGNRDDTHIIDEPFYGYYLKNQNVNHPGEEEILLTMESEMAKILEKHIFAYYKKDVLFIKNMAHHYIGVDPSILLELENVFLIRDLKKLIYSFSKVIPDPSLQDIGIKEEFLLFEYLREKGKLPLVIDSDELLKNPRFVLQQLCLAINIPFSESLLNWKAGPRKEDGVWAKYWYHNVHRSTQFSKPEHQEINLSKNLDSLFHEALPYYEKMHSFAIKAPN